MAVKVILDAGHGGYDGGASYEGRLEKEDNLEITLAVGEILEKNGVDVLYTRVEDAYDSPLRKAQIANESGADIFVSIHRNSSEFPSTYSGVQTLIYDNEGIKDELARNINEELAMAGFRNLGISIRKDLAVLRRTQMPAVLVEVGFINTPADNEILDNNFEGVVQAIANGILKTINIEGWAQGSGLTGSSGAGGASGAGGMSSSGMSGAGGMTGNGMSGVGGMLGNASQINGTPGAGGMLGNASQINGMSGAGGMTGNTGNGMSGAGGMTGNTGNASQINGMQGAGGMLGNTGNGMPGAGWMTGNGMQGAGTGTYRYHVQVGLYRNRENANAELKKLEALGIPSQIISSGEYYALQAGDFGTMAEGNELERQLKQLGYDTLLIAVRPGTQM